jgi:thiamine-monophosphate kinase
MMEREFHRWLKEQSLLSTDDSEIVQVGIGDDAAILGGLVEEAVLPRIVVTTDGLAESTHFDLNLDSLELVGRKMIAVNLSDLAAMGASPLAAVINLNLPRSFAIEHAQQLFLGGRNLADQFKMPIIGGDTNRWDGPLVVSSTLIGLDLTSQQSKPPWLLSGAQPGDMILVSGRLGGSILGRHLTFQPKITLARYLVENYLVHSATDISDSLSLDLALMAAASGKRAGLEGLGVELLVDQIPVHEDAVELAKRTGSTVIEHALTDGEDFELLLSVSPSEYERMSGDVRLKETDMQLTRIGTFVSKPGFWLCRNEHREPFCPRGYSH